jgi:hypothetical protein
MFSLRIISLLTVCLASSLAAAEPKVAADVLLGYGVFDQDVLKDSEKAAAHFREVLAIDGISPELEAEATLRLNICRHGQGEGVAAREDVDALLKKYAGNASVTAIVTRFLLPERTDPKPVAEATPVHAIQEKLDNIILPRVSFKEATVHTVITYLKQRSKDLDPKGEGISFFLQLAGPTPAAEGDYGEPIDDFAKPTPQDAFANHQAEDPFAAKEEGADEGDEVFEPEPGATPQEITITLDFDNIPLGELIRYVCQVANLKYKVERFAVVIAGRDVPLDDMETRIYPASAEHMNGYHELGVVAFFEEVGVEFPQGAKAFYREATEKLIVTNTPDNLRKVEMLMHGLVTPESQVSLQCELVEITDSAYLEGLTPRHVGADTIRAIPIRGKTIRSTLTALSLSGNTSVTRQGVIGAEVGGLEDGGDVLEFTPMIDPDAYTVGIELNWKHMLAGQGRRLKVDTLLNLWDGEAVALKVGAADQAGGLGDLYLIIDCTLLNPGGLPIRSDD